jgi:hypothetical protein
MDAHFITPDAPEWPETLALVRHDFYHLPEFAALDGRKEDGEAVAFLAREGEARFLVPLILRRIGPELAGRDRLWFDATCPYGYPGPLIYPAEPTPKRFVERAVNAFVEGLRERGVVTAFCRLHPLLNDAPAPLARVGRLVEHGMTVSVDLTLSHEEIRRQWRRDHRQNVRRAWQQGQTARMDEEWQHFDEFLDIYYETMRRVGAGSHYFFSREYFLELRRILGQRLHLCVVELGGRVVSAGLFSEMCGIVEYHLSGTPEQFLRQRPMKTLLDFTCRWAKDRGNEVLHLGGGVNGRDDSLFHFKAGFSPRRHAFYTWRIIADEAAYRELVCRWQAWFGQPVDVADGFFPAYRRSHPEG